MPILDCQNVDGVVVLSPVVPRLDLDTIDAFRSEFQEAVMGAERVLLDMSHLDFCDSAGFGALVVCRSYVTRQGGDFRLCGLSASMHRVFEFMRLNLIMKHYPRREQAIRRMTGVDNQTVYDE